MTSPRQARDPSVGIGVLLAGGEARRMGFDKRTQWFGGSTLLERNAAVLREVFPRLAISLRAGAAGRPGARRFRGRLRRDAGGAAGRHRQRPGPLRRTDLRAGRRHGVRRARGGQGGGRGVRRRGRRAAGRRRALRAAARGLWTRLHGAPARHAGAGRPHHPAPVPAGAPGRGALRLGGAVLQPQHARRPRGGQPAPRKRGPRQRRAAPGAGLRGGQERQRQDDPARGADPRAACPRAARRGRQARRPPVRHRRARARTPGGWVTPAPRPTSSTRRPSSPS